jgi:hypothetical protein
VPLMFAEDHETIIENGTVIAVRQGGHVEVWDCDGEIHFGNLPETATKNDILTAYCFYAAGRKRGEHIGAYRLQVSMRSLLGL